MAKHKCYTNEDEVGFDMKGNKDYYCPICQKLIKTIKIETMQRQAMVTTIKELLNIIAELRKEDISEKQKVQLNIVNKTSCSDTWKFEKVK